jgi:hypothetical protein
MEFRYLIRRDNACTTWDRAFKYCAGAGRAPGGSVIALHCPLYGGISTCWENEWAGTWHYIWWRYGVAYIVIKTPRSLIRRVRRPACYGGYHVRGRDRRWRRPSFSGFPMWHKPGRRTELRRRFAVRQTDLSWAGLMGHSCSNRTIVCTLG